MERPEDSCPRLEGLSPPKTASAGFRQEATFRVCGSCRLLKLWNAFHKILLLFLNYRAANRCSPRADHDVLSCDFGPT